MIISDKQELRRCVKQLVRRADVCEASLSFDMAQDETGVMAMMDLWARPGVTPSEALMRTTASETPFSPDAAAMFAAAMIAVAATTTNIKDILLGGLAQIPHTSRLYTQVTELMQDYENGVSQDECFARIHKRYDEHNPHDWCHTISNALIVAASLLYGGGDYGKSICMAVQTGFDTDCNGATVGSILGMAFGESCIDKQWSDPIQNTLYATIFGKDKLKISDCVDLTMKHVQL